jgi:phosphoribosylanthranilate isomerase
MELESMKLEFINQRTRIKICGLTREADVDAAVAAGADAVGFVLYAKSPRHVSLVRAAELTRRLPPFVTPVCLLVNASDTEVTAATAAMPTAMLQFHGDETPELCARAERPYMRAAHITPDFDLPAFAAQFFQAQALLLDAPAPGYGGGGQVFDWTLVRSTALMAPPFVLAGGLHAENVASGIAQLRPWAVDVSSGVESAPGLKDADAIRRFCDAVREADARVASSVA